MQDAPVFERGKEGEDATLIIPWLVTAFLAGSAVNLLFLARKWTGEKNAQKARPNIYIYLRAGFSTDGPMMTQFSGVSPVPPLTSTRSFAFCGVRSAAF